MHHEKAKKSEIIFSVTQNLHVTCELPQFLCDFGDYACKLKNYIILSVCNFAQCTITKKSHDLLAQFVINRYS